MVKHQDCLKSMKQGQSSTMGARAWISMPGQGYPPGGRYIPAPAGVFLLLEKKNTPARAWAFFLREEYPCPGMGVLLAGRIPLPGQGYPCPGRGVHIIFLALNIKVVQ